MFYSGQKYKNKNINNKTKQYKALQNKNLKK